MQKSPDYETACKTARERLKLAWSESMSKSTLSHALAFFQDNIKDILDQSRLMHPWKTDELPYTESASTPRGPLIYMAPFRQAFWKRYIAGLLSAAFEKGKPMVGLEFWHDEFPEAWCRNIAKQPPPISPSVKLPANHNVPYARDPEYIEWANGPFRDRIARLHPQFRICLNDQMFDPNNPAALHTHAWALSGASALVLAEKLGLFTESKKTPGIVKYLESDGELKFRYRKQGHILWPPEDKRPYVDLNLAPIFAQILVYDPNDWNTTFVCRSLPLKEGGAIGNNDDNLKHTNLIRADIELAVWCEIASRCIAGSANAFLPPPDSHDHGQHAMTAFDRLLPHQVPWAKEIIKKARELAGDARSDQMRDGSGFFHRQGVQSEWQLGDGVAVLSPERTTPVLEDDNLRCHLDWNWIAPEGDWMDLRLIVLTADGSPEYLEYHETTPEDASDDDPASLSLFGSVWESLKRDYSEDELRAAFGNTLFGRRISDLGTGAFALGLIDLSGA